MPGMFPVASGGLHPEELMDLAELMSREQQYVLSPEGKEAFKEYLERRMEQPRFANARSVRNTLHRLRMRHAIRLWKAATQEGRKLTKGDLVTTQAEDVRNRSRVFDDEAGPDREETH